MFTDFVLCENSKMFIWIKQTNSYDMKMQNSREFILWPVYLEAGWLPGLLLCHILYVLSQTYSPHVPHTFVSPLTQSVLEEERNQQDFWWTSLQLSAASTHRLRYTWRKANTLDVSLHLVLKLPIQTPNNVYGWYWKASGGDCVLLNGLGYNSACCRQFFIQAKSFSVNEFCL